MGGLDQKRLTKQKGKGVVMIFFGIFVVKTRYSFKLEIIGHVFTGNGIAKQIFQIKMI